MKELQLATLNVFFRLFILFSARFSALIIMLSDSPFKGIGKWEPFLIFK
jgi:hypothetical protein